MSTVPRSDLHGLTREDLRQRWERVLRDPELGDLPYKIETNRYGQIVMTPHKPAHSGYQGLLAELLKSHMPAGVIVPELAIVTEDGVKVVDVAWMSPAIWTHIRSESAASRAPELCVEVLSERNTLPEIERKVALYFAQGAQEAWICDEGHMRIYAPAEPEPRVVSALAPGFPAKIALPE
ncbi:MAG: Uma2 family endonuclease [Gammaproteobacteria bacterium]